MPRYSVRLKRTADSFIHLHEVDAANLTAAQTVATAMSVSGGSSFDAPEVELVGGGAADWGDIGGTLADQSDLQAALDALAADLAAHEGALDPHPIYTTVPECDLLYEPFGILAAHTLVHAPSSAQKNSDITKAEIEAKLTGEIASHTHAGGGLTLAQVYPVGCIYTTTTSANPATVFGFGTWAAFGTGRVLVGFDAGQTEFDTVEETGGAKAVAAAGTNSAPTFTGTPFSSVINHTHAVSVSDPGHSHVITSQTATTGAATSYEHGVLDTSSAETEATETTASATTGVTATTANPAGGVASITPAGTVSAPAFTGSGTSVLQPYLVVFFWKRTA